MLVQAKSILDFRSPVVKGVEILAPSIAASQVSVTRQLDRPAYGRKKSTRI